MLPLTGKLLEEWLRGQDEAKNLTQEEFDHVFCIMENMSKWYNFPDRCPLGHFGTYIIENKFKEAVLQADLTNLKCLRLYALFLNWCLPMDYMVRLVKH